MSFSPQLKVADLSMCLITTSGRKHLLAVRRALLTFGSLKTCLCVVFKVV